MKILDEIGGLKYKYFIRNRRSPTRVLIDSDSLATYLAFNYGAPQYSILGLDVFVKYLPCGKKEKIIIVE